MFSCECCKILKNIFLIEYLRATGSALSWEFTDIYWKAIPTKTCNQLLKLFHDGGRYHMETSPLIYRANQWTGFYMITASVMKKLN